MRITNFPDTINDGSKCVQSLEFRVRVELWYIRLKQQYSYICLLNSLACLYFFKSLRSIVVYSYLNWDQAIKPSRCNQACPRCFISFSYQGHNATQLTRDKWDHNRARTGGLTRWHFAVTSNKHACLVTELSGKQNELNIRTSTDLSLQFTLNILPIHDYRRAHSLYFIVFSKFDLHILGACYMKWTTVRFIRCLKVHACMPSVCVFLSQIDDIFEWTLQSLPRSVCFRCTW